MALPATLIEPVDCFDELGFDELGDFREDVRLRAVAGLRAVVRLRAVAGLRAVAVWPGLLGLLLLDEPRERAGGFFVAAGPFDEALGLV